MDHGIFFILLPKNLSWKVVEKSWRAKSETPWLRRNRASEPWNWPTKSHRKDRGIVYPWRQSRAGRVLRRRTWEFPIFSTWCGGSISGLGRSIYPQPRRFRLWALGFPDFFFIYFFCNRRQISIELMSIVLSKRLDDKTEQLKSEITWEKRMTNVEGWIVEVDTVSQVIK